MVADLALDLSTLENEGLTINLDTNPDGVILVLNAEMEWNRVIVTRTAIDAMPLAS